MIGALNLSLEAYGWRVELHGWEDRGPTGGRPQADINADVERCDLFLGILWRRWGTPTGDSRSGFAEEWELAQGRFARTGHPDLWLYFKDVGTDAVEDEQLAEVRAFRQRVEESEVAFYKTFADLAEFENRVRQKILGAIFERTELTRADIGVLAYATRHHPGLRRHLSVQASAANAPSIAFYRENFDIKRVVLPRVFSIEEVTALIAEIGIETEVFAFGSVGPMSEGRCFLSSYFTGLSPTSEGACAPASHVIFLEKDGRVLSTLGQVTLNSFARGEPAAYPTPCKGRYVTHGRASYLFEEPVALNAISILPELKAAGVTALKIEGRQRSRAYVTQIVGTFRQALDALARGDSSFTAIGQLEAEAEGGRETFGAYHKGWR